MKFRQNLFPTISMAVLVAVGMMPAAGQMIQDPPFGRPDAVVDLASREGAQLIHGQWRYHDVKIVDADSRAVGPDLKASGDPIRTYDYSPHAHHSRSAPVHSQGVLQLVSHQRHNSRDGR
jgi:hypothetical protein